MEGSSRTVTSCDSLKIYTELELEALLVLAGAIPADMLKTKPTASISRKLGDDDADEETQSRSAATRVNAPSAKNIRSRTRVEDDDSDFDL